MVGRRTTVDVDGHRLRLTSLDKVMYPATGTTKGDVVRYVSEMAEHIVRHAGGRPVTRKRWPGGVGTDDDPGSSFFAKDIGSGAPGWVPRHELPHSDHVNTYPLADDRATLVWFAQMSTLEVHVPQWRFDPGGRGPMNPDRLVLDLDPGEGAGLAQCVEVAHLVRPILDGMGLVTVPVTSGSKGIHLYAGLDGAATSADVEAVARELARTLEDERPDLVVSRQRRTLREGRVLLDWSQNSASKTTVAPYSLRGRTRPTVAVPRTWEELDDPGLGQLTIDEVLERMSGADDPLAVIAPRERAGTAAGGAADRLTTYRDRRDPDRTPEPIPPARVRTGGGGRRRNGDTDATFVIQEHHARGFHHDLRLEDDGVLASWAVPKGVPPGRSRDRLAVRTEDHPLEYATFEGTIPRGSYGAGTMTIWDTGTYERESWTDDKITVTLRGSPGGGLGGRPRRFALVRTGRTSGDDDQWLLHATKDQPVSDAGPPAPMLAVLGRAGEVEGDGWVAEPKWDGVRAVCVVAGERARLFSRTGKELTAAFPELSASLVAGLRTDAVVDGEIVALDARARPSFSLLQQRLGLERERDVRAAMAEVPTHLFLFDVLEVEGREVTDETYVRRREILEDLVRDSGRGRLQVPPDLGDDVDEALAISAELGLEGLVAKRAGSTYRPGSRSSDWVKVKHERTQEVVVVGLRRGNGALASTFGSLLLAVPVGGELRYVGRVGTGFDDRRRRRIRAELDDVRADKPPADVPPADAHDATWVEPVRVGEVSYAGWTGAGRLRHPVWRGWRPEKAPRDVVVEDPSGLPPAGSGTPSGGTTTTTRAPRARTTGPTTRRKGNDMPKDEAPSLKNPEMYEALRDDGASKEKAARISNAAAKEGKKKVGRRGGESGSYDDWTVDELKDRAKELGISGYSDKKKAELVDMLRNH